MVMLIKVYHWVCPRPDCQRVHETTASSERPYCRHLGIGTEIPTEFIPMVRDETKDRWV